jgi:hypothetical protein
LYGFPEGSYKQFEHPVVVFVIDEDLALTPELFDVFNRDDRMQHGAVEEAIKIGKVIKPETIGFIAGKLADVETMGDINKDPETRAAIFDRLIEDGLLTRQMLPKYLNAEYGITDDGKNFLETALMGSVLDENVVKSINTDGAKRFNLTVLRVLPSIVENKGLEGYSINREFNDAMRIAVTAAKSKFPDVRHYAEQATFFAPENPASIALAERLEKGQVSFAKFFRALEGELKRASAGEADLLTGGVESRDDILTRYLGVDPRTWNPDAGALMQTREAREEARAEARRQYQEVYNRYHDAQGNALPGWLAMPKGTNLTERQWVQVHTDNFKKWFGDWEHDSKNVSWVVDNNDWPLVVYHGFRGRAYTEYKPEMAVFKGFWASDDVRLAEDYSEGGQISVFLNAKNFLDIPFESRSYVTEKEFAEFLNDNGIFVETDALDDESEIDVYDLVNKYADEISKKYYGIKQPEEGFTSFCVFSPNQIKSATDNEGTFDTGENNTLFQVIGERADLEARREAILEELKGFIGPKQYRDLTEELQRIDIKIARTPSAIAERARREAAIAEELRGDGDDVDPAEGVSRWKARKRAWAVQNAIRRAAELKEIREGAIVEREAAALDRARESEEEAVEELRREAVLPRDAKTLTEAEAIAMDEKSGFVNKPITNQLFGITATISKRSLDEMTNEKLVKKAVSPRLQAKAVANADVLYERAVLHVPHPDIHKRENVEQVHRFGALMEDGGEYTPVKLTVIEYKSDEKGNRLYAIEAVDVEKMRSAGLLAQAGTNPEIDAPIADLNKSLIQLYEQVNRKSPPTRISLDVLAGKVNPSRIDGGTLFQVLGEKGAAELDRARESTERLGSLAVAREMEAANEEARRIRLATGWERGADRKWRYEIPEVEWRVQNNAVPGYKPPLEGTTEGTLGYEIVAPDLFDAYPQLKDVAVEINFMFYGDNANTRGYYDSDKKKIVINGRTEFSARKSILIHEIQHAVQDIEGFARGGSPDSTADSLLVEDDVASWWNDEGGAGEEVPFDELSESGREEAIQRYKDEVLSYSGYDLYHRLAGEVEARNVEARLGLSPEERRAKLLAETEDVAREDQVVLLEGAEAAERAERVLFQEAAALFQDEVDGGLADEILMWGDDWEGFMAWNEGRGGEGVPESERVVGEDGQADQERLRAWYRTMFEKVREGAEAAAVRDAEAPIRGTATRHGAILSDSRVRRAAAGLSDTGLAEDLASRALEMGDERLVEGETAGEEEILSAKERLRELNEAVRDDIKRLTSEVDKETVRLHEQLIEARRKLWGVRKEIANRVSAGIKSIEREREQEIFFEHEYRNLADRIKMNAEYAEISGDAREAIARLEERDAIEGGIAPLLANRNALAEVKRIRQNLVRRIMRRAPIAAVHMDQARAVGMLQILLEPNLLESLDKMLGSKNPGSLRVIFSRFKTDEKFREESLKKIGSKLSAQEVEDILARTARYEDLTLDQKRFLITHFGEQTWARALGLREKAARRNKELKIPYKMEADAEGKLQIALGEDAARELAEKVPADILARIQNKSFAEWTQN